MTDNPRAAHIRVIITNAKQPFHCALVASNGETTWTTENLVDHHGARRAIAWLGSFISPVNRSTVTLPPGLASNQDGTLEVWLDDQELGERLDIPIRVVDERTNGGA